MLVPREIFKIHAAAGDGKRGSYRLDAIQFERDSQGVPHAVVTDGRKMVVVSWPTNNFSTESGLVSSAEAKQVCKPSKTGALPLATLLDDKVVVTTKGYDTHDVEVPRRVKEERFPKWKEVVESYVPDDERSQSVKVDAKLLMQSLKALIDSNATGGDNNEVVLTVSKDNIEGTDASGRRIGDYGHEHCLLLTSSNTSNGRKGFCILMQVADSCNGSLKPRWIPERTPVNSEAE